MWIEFLLSISLSDQDKQKTKKWLSHTYYKLSFYNEVIKIVASMDKPVYPPYEKLSLARTYEALGNPEAKTVFQELIENFPQLCLAHYYYTLYLINHNHLDAKIKLLDFEKNWPNSPKLYLLQFQKALKSKNPHPEIILKQAIARFPYFAKSYFILMDYYADKNKEEVKTLQKLGQERFPGHPKFQTFIPQIKLTPAIQAAFNSLKGVKGTAYLINNALFELINPIYKTLDIEMLIVLEKEAEFSAKEYIPSTNPYIYHLKDHTPLISCHISPETNLTEDAKRVCFTLFALYCDEKGQILDPTQKALPHAKAGILDTITNPELILDTELMFSTCKFIARGYRPTKRLTRAMKIFIFEDNLDLDQIKALVKFHLTDTAIREKYLTQLIEYNLLPLFGIHNAKQLSMDKLLLTLEKALNANPPQENSTNSWARMFQPAPKNTHPEPVSHGLSEEFIYT